MKAKTEFLNLFNSLSRKYSRHEVFDDFLSLTICCFSQGEQEEQYHNIRLKYASEEFLIFSQMLGATISGMDGLYDFLGHIYEEITSSYKSKHMGQYFTPQPISDMMAQILSGGKAGRSRICDPTCGSGRMLLAMAKMQTPFERYNSLYVGMDLDHMVLKITVINACLNGLFGEYYHMNTLSMEYFNAYQVRLKNGLPSITLFSKEHIEDLNNEGSTLVEKALEQHSEQMTLF